MRAPRLILAAIVLGTVAASGAGVAVHAAASAPCASKVTNLGKDWQGIKPNFPAGEPSTITQFVNATYAPDQMYVTNGQTAMYSQDAGCHWIPLRIPAATGPLSGLPTPPIGSVPTPKITTTITAIAAPSSGNLSSYAYVGAEDSSVLGNSIRIGHYDGNVWSWTSKGLPTGKVVEIAASPSLPMFAYALVAKTSVLDQNPGLYVTKDGGNTWALEDANADPSTLNHITVDPNVPQLVYAMGSGNLLASRDGGRSFSPVGAAGSGLSSYGVALASNGLQMVVGHGGQRSFGLSGDAGSTWTSVPVPVRTKSVAIQPILGKVALSDGSQLYRFDMDNAGSGRTGKCKAAKPSSGGSTHGKCVSVATSIPSANISPPGNVAITGLQFTAPTTTYSLSGFHGDQILREVFKLDGTALPPGVTPLTLLPGSTHQFPSTLLPGKSRITLPPGGHRDVSYQLLLPRTPSPVDVMFLVDTTSSTEHTIAGLRRDLAGIVNELGGAGLNAEFGVGDFKDYPPKQWEAGDGDTGDYPYRLDARIGPVTPHLRAALSNLRASGGGDPAEADLTALYQSTTGAGQKLGKHVILPPGLEAGYRPDALKLAVIATDEVFHQAKDYLTPSWDKTIGALRSYDVHPIGLAIQYTDDNANVGGFRSLRTEQRLATDAGSLAPRGGVDCNGDLKVDIPAGGPFVCKVQAVQTSTLQVGKVVLNRKLQPVHLTSAITTAAELFADYRAVGLAVGGHPGIARVITPRAMPTVNLKVDNVLHFTVRYTCPRLPKPAVYPIGLHAGAGGRVFASSAADVACGAVPPKKHPALPLPVAAAVIAAPAAPAAPGTPGNPPPNTNPNPNPALNANMGFASQEEEQRQLAFADADAGMAEDTSTELAMSRLAIGAAVLLAGAAGFAARHRFAHRESTAAAWHRRR